LFAWKHTQLMESEIAYAMVSRPRISWVPLGAWAFSSRNFSMFLTFLKAYKCLPMLWDSTTAWSMYAAIAAAAAADGDNGGGDGGGDGCGDGGCDSGGDDTASGQGDENEESWGHPAGSAAAKAAGGAAKGKAPPTGRKKKWAFCGPPYPLAQLPWWRVK
jgi:hypothetical protein